jgi:hypothetical protein
MRRRGPLDQQWWATFTTACPFIALIKVVQDGLYEAVLFFLFAATVSAVWFAARQKKWSDRV